jgi:hypothetical protein
MKNSLLIAASLVLGCFVTSPVVAQEDSPVFGRVVTNKKTALKTAPNAHAAASVMVDANTELRWIGGDRKENYVRVMVPKGPHGWVLERNVKEIAVPDLSIALERAAQPCVRPETLNACTTEKPTGCSPADSAHGLVNKKKREVPAEGPAVTVTFETFSQLQGAAVELVDEGIEIEPSDRAQIKKGSIDTTEGKLGEGDRVRLVAFLSQGKPHANTGESVNCNLKREENNDIHISVTETKNGSEFQSIVVEMIPQDRPDNWTSRRVAKLRGKVVLIEGALFYDNLHFTNADADNPLQGQPKRFSLWEIHPVTSLKVCKKPTVTQCNSDRDADWKEF